MRVEPLALPLRSEGREQLMNLLIDAVHAGASIGFLAPLGREEVHEYWVATERAAAMGDRVILVARNAAGPILGTAQIAFVSRANGRPRAEVRRRSFTAVSADAASPVSS